MHGERTSALNKPSAFCRQVCSALILAAAFGAATCHRGPTIVDRLEEQTRRYPEMQMEDAYKFVHQAAFGNGHMITDETADRENLKSELASVEAGDSEPVVDPVSPDGSVVRINLRPFKARGLDATKLGDVVIQSAKQFAPDRERFERWWTEVADGTASRK